MMHLKATRADKTARFQTLCRFLCQAGISQQLSTSIQKQVLEQESIQQNLSISDVPVLATLSSSLQVELRYEISTRHLTSHPLLHLYMLVDINAVKKLCFKLVDFVTLLPGSTLFLAGDEARGAYVVMGGSLKYLQSPASSKVPDAIEMFLEQGQWICEAALWTHWTHVGTLEAVSACELLMLKADQFLAELSEHKVLGRINCHYAKSFLARLISAVPPEVPWPNDLSVPFTEYDEIVCSMDVEMRSFIGMVSFEMYQQTTWFWDNKSVEQLKEEVLTGRCTLLVSNVGKVFRVVAVTALRITNAEGHILVQVGRWEHGRAVPKVALPGTKQRTGETPAQAAKRIVDTDLKAIIGNGMEWGLAETNLEWRESEQYRLRTKYIRTVHDAKLEVVPAPVSLARVNNVCGALEGAALPCEVSIFEAVTPSGVGLYAWLPPSGFSSVQSPAGSNLLATCLARLNEDDFVLMAPASVPPAFSEDVKRVVAL